MKREKHSRPLVRTFVCALVFLSLFVFAQVLPAQNSIEGHWEGTVALPSKTIPVQVDFDHAEKDWHATLLFPETTAPVYAAKSVTMAGNGVWISLEMGFSTVVFEGEVSGNNIEGTFTQDNTKAKFKLAHKAGMKAGGEDARGHSNSAPVPAAEERSTTGPAKTEGRNESGATNSGNGAERTLAATSSRVTVIRDEEGESRGVVPTQKTIGASNGMPNFYAVLFGDDVYDSPDWPHLNNPIEDVKSIGQELHSFYGFDTQVWENQTYSGIRHILTEEVAKTNFKPDDELLIYFAGHGDFDESDGRGYVIARDSSAPGVDRERQVDFDQLTKWVDKLNVRHILLVLDICKGGSIFLGGERGEIQAPAVADRADAVQRLEGVKTRKCMTSGGMGSVKDGRAGQGSPFARTFMEVLGEAGPNTDDMVLNMDTVAGKVMKIMGRMPGASRPEYGACASDKPTSEFFFFWQAAAK